MPDFIVEIILEMYHSEMKYLIAQQRPTRKSDAQFSTNSHASPYPCAIRTLRR